MGVRVEEVDPRDDRAFAGWYAVLAAGWQAERPGEPHWTEHEQRTAALELVAPGGDRSGVLLAARDGATTTGAARLSLPEADNRHLAQLVLHVHPDAVRRGTGTALLQECVRRARAAGRTALVGEVDEPPGRPAPGRAFAERAGASLALESVRRDLDLPVPDDRLDELDARCRPYAAGYRVVTWRDRTPQRWVDDRALLARRMSTEVPLGELPLQEEHWDAARLRAHEDGLVAQDRTWFTAAAVHEGRLVGHTDVGVPRAVPQRAYQWDTLVLPEHRGSRLGTLLKVAVLRSLQAGSPATRLLSTWNAEVNAPMIAVNEALGFRTAGRLSGWSLDLRA